MSNDQKPAAELLREVVDDKAPYFSWHAPTNEFEHHATLDEARKTIENALDDDCDGDTGWDDATPESCYGIALGGVVETSRRPREQQDAVPAECDEIVSYGVADNTAARAWLEENPAGAGHAPSTQVNETHFTSAAAGSDVGVTPGGIQRRVALGASQPVPATPTEDAPTLEECEAVFHAAPNQLTSGNPILWTRAGIEAVRSFCLGSPAAMGGTRDEVIEAAAQVCIKSASGWRAAGGLHSEKMQRLAKADALDRAACDIRALKSKPLAMTQPGEGAGKPSRKLCGYCGHADVVHMARSVSGFLCAAQGCDCTRSPLHRDMHEDRPSPVSAEKRDVEAVIRHFNREMGGTDERSVIGTLEEKALRSALTLLGAPAVYRVKTSRKYSAHGLRLDEVMSDASERHVDSIRWDELLGQHKDYHGPCAQIASDHEELEKWRYAASQLCGAHVGVKQTRCPACERDELKVGAPAVAWPPSEQK